MLEVEIQDQNQSSKYNLPPVWTWVDILLVSITTIVIVIAGAVAMTLLESVRLPDFSADDITLGYSAGLAAIEAFAILLSIYLFGIVRKRLPWNSIGLNRASPKWMLAAVLLAIAIIPVIGLIATLVQLIFGLPLENPQLPFLAPGDFSWGGAAGMLLAGGILVPFAEELFFRGLLYRWLRQFWPAWAGMVVSSVIFGVLHGDFAVGVATFFMGLLLAWFYEKSQSLWPSIAIHMLNNGVKLLLLYVLIAAGIDVNAF